MTTPKRSARKGSQVPRLDRAMTALAEAQVRTGAIMSQLARTMTALADARSEADAELSNLSPETRALGRQLLAYLNKLPKN
jgi:ABC-type transporter Mla subunit MlaD